MGDFQEVLEEKVLLKYEDQEQIAKLRGVKQWPLSDSLRIEKHLFRGKSFRATHPQHHAIVGQALAHTLSISADQYYMPLKVFVPSASAKVGSLEKPFSERSWYVSGLYAVQASFDASYVITSLESVQEFLDKPQRVTSIEIQVNESDPKSQQDEIQAFFRFRGKKSVPTTRVFVQGIANRKVGHLLYFGVYFVDCHLYHCSICCYDCLEKEKTSPVYGLWALKNLSFREFSLRRSFNHLFWWCLRYIFGSCALFGSAKIGFIQIGTQGSLSSTASCGSSVGRCFDDYADC